MVQSQGDNSAQVRHLQDSVQRLEHSLAEMQHERERLIRRRRTQLLLVGIAVSLLAHIILLVYLATVYWQEGGSGGGQTVSFEFATVQDEQLTELQETRFDELVPEDSSEIQAPATDVPTATIDPSAVGEPNDLGLKGIDSTLGGSGSASGGGTLGGAGAGTSFFGVSSRGTRFCYIVDVSASMQSDLRLQATMQQLAQSISGLPDYGYVYILLFASNITEPPMQRGWTRARKSTINQIIRWLNTVSPGGGTEPVPAFFQAFALDTRPDVIFFLTDGEIPAATADEVAALNSRGKRVTINTFAFGNPASQEQLRQIARDSGGTYRFVPSGGN